MLGRAARPFALSYFYVEGLVYKRPRVRVAVYSERGEILLVKSWIGTRDWELPGGGVNRGESWVSAARRELREETGISVPEEVLKHAFTAKGYGGCDLPVFTALVKRADLPKQPYSRREIIAIKWHDAAQLTEVTPQVHEITAKLAASR